MLAAKTPRQREHVNQKYTPALYRWPHTIWIRLEE